MVWRLRPGIVGDCTRRFGYPLLCGAPIKFIYSKFICSEEQFIFSRSCGASALDPVFDCSALCYSPFAIAAAFLLHGMRRRGLGFLAAALLVIVSRVYVGTHYASDVLGGAVTGIIAAAVVRSVYWEGTRADRFVTSIL
jgi:hypothetical protein